MQRVGFIRSLIKTLQGKHPQIADKLFDQADVIEHRNREAIRKQIKGLSLKEIEELDISDIL